MFLRTILTLWVLVIISTNVKSQTKNDLFVANAIFDTKKDSVCDKFSNFDSNNELQLLTYGSFVFYKNFFSSQDGNVCIFYPSCSLYAIKSIKKNGFVIGVLDGIDRLQRCNTLSTNSYKKYKNTHLLHDPVD